MIDKEITFPEPSLREPWNKGKLIGTKPPLRPKHVWTIRTKLQIAQHRRDLALFNLAIDSKLRGCDVVNIKVDDVALRGYAVDRATVRQKKLANPFASKLLNKPGRQLMTTSRQPIRNPASICSLVGVERGKA